MFLRLLQELSRKRFAQLRDKKSIAPTPTLHRYGAFSLERPAATWRTRTEGRERQPGLINEAKKVTFVTSKRSKECALVRLAQQIE